MNVLDRPAFLLNRLDLADRVITQVGHPNLALQYDLYHAAANGQGWRESLLPRLASVGHIQISDCPGRGPPGTGLIDFAGFFAALREVGHDGWIGCEYTSNGATPDSLAWRRLLD